MNVYGEKGNTVNAYKMPLYRSVHCPAYEANGECEYYGTSFIECGSWEGSICLHPEAEGNKNGWLISCPLAPISK